MLYKKYHRQYVREFREGRKFEHRGSAGGVFGVYEVIGKPYISGRYIQVDEIDYSDEGTEEDSIVVLNNGKMICEITWLD